MIARVAESTSFLELHPASGQQLLGTRSWGPPPGAQRLSLDHASPGANIFPVGLVEGLRSTARWWPSVLSEGPPIHSPLPFCEAQKSMEASLHKHDLPHPRWLIRKTGGRWWTWQDVQKTEKQSLASALASNSSKAKLEQTPPPCCGHEHVLFAPPVAG